jgi:hypothetical protein
LGQPFGKDGRFPYPQTVMGDILEEAGLWQNLGVGGKLLFEVML